MRILIVEKLKLSQFSSNMSKNKTKIIIVIKVELFKKMVDGKFK